VAGCGQRLKGSLQLGGQSAQRAKLLLVGGEFGLVGQLAMDEQMSDFFKLTGVCKVQDVVAAVVQVVAAAANCA